MRSGRVLHLAAYSDEQRDRVVRSLLPYFLLPTAHRLPPAYCSLLPTAYLL